MNREELLQHLQERFSDAIVGVYEKSAKRIYIQIQADSLVRFAQFLFKDIGARFNIASGVDGRTQMEILYHFTVEDIDLVISLRVILPKTQLEIASLTSVFTAAHWIEREIHELLGVNFVGHPQLTRLLLPEDWPEGVYPLRKDYKEWDPNAIRDRGV
ncbi:MAG: NADH-quinone oxidoreductase subunit C [Nitrospirota bacterium]|nr:MAG: NADH-quinone oxidoreductase subunit C [Nitrospirota bacterium]